MVKNRNIGLKLKSKEFTPPGFQSNKILKNPIQKPINKLPESPRYSFAGGKLNTKKPRIENNKTIDKSVNLFWLK